MTKRVKTACRFLGALMLGAAWTAASAETLRIAVLPFAGAGAAIDVAGVIESDLVRSGAFKALPRAEALALTGGAALDADAGQRLRGAGLTHVLSGSASSGELSFSLRDLATDTELLAAALPLARPDLLRAAAHQVADRVHERVVGVRGAFDTQLAYVQKRGSGPEASFQLVICDADGENPRVLAASREPLMSPVWSPDRTRIAFVGYDNGRSAVYVQTLSTLAVRKIVSEPGLNGAPAWSPDGRALALTMSAAGSADIYVIDLDSGERRRLTDSRAIDTEPSWSPDGRSIAFTSDRAGTPQIYVMPSSGGEARRLPIAGKQNLRPQYSPDGRSLAVVNYDSGRYRIALVDLQTGALRRVSEGPHDESPSFSPNGKAVTYSGRGSGGRSQLHVANLDGSMRQTLRGDDDIREPAWSPMAP